MAVRSEGVFLNCPFDTADDSLFRALVFAVHDAGFVARCALEVTDASENRLAKIVRIISDCRYGIHDISRTEPGAYGLPRFNMPLELGVFLGAKVFGGYPHAGKVCLIMDRLPYRYQRFISDIAGQDVVAHKGRPTLVIREVRDWLRTTSRRSAIPSGAAIARRFDRFHRQLPEICREASLDIEHLPFVDYTHVVLEWLRENAPD